MRAELIYPNGNYKREVWGFYLDVSFGHSCIYFDSFSFQTRETKRHKWKNQSHWVRLDRRSNNIDKPEIPSYVEQDMRTKFHEFIQTLPIES